ncbi:hypothetical protein BGZ61DRAFT_440134 [Ilyonectria robusta]|uniref:uncharacterized protein n=1 Tax=Ilyonectria robusta TaxID=1079257 RepID=UPI001E8DCCDF|nr:uncharacterized protein BGZ61DRAFT_440134 [Ilyonectria robusta]KAH8735378.1 hypothetical protein BGZ61DRAFT_440134 [Ilyonectria robusta]
MRAHRKQPPVTASGMPPAPVSYHQYTSADHTHKSKRGDRQWPCPCHPPAIMF